LLNFCVQTIPEVTPLRIDFIRCPACCGGIDCRDLSQVFEREGPLPHLAQIGRNDQEKASATSRASSMAGSLPVASKR
jgi:hypothetical protein